MNKKGFLKILEAIIAILIVFGFIITIIPEKPKPTAKLPPNLEQTIDQILKEIQESPEFRKCVLGGTSVYFEGTSDSQCIYEYVQFITRPNELHPWDYVVRICKQDSGVIECNYYGKETNSEGDLINYDEINNEDELRNNVLPQDKNIYIKSVTISLHDILGEREAGEPVDIAADETAIDTGIIHILTIFSWSKS